MAVSILRIVNAAGEVFCVKILEQLNDHLLVPNQWGMSKTEPDH